MRRIIITGIALACLALAGCGDDDTGSPGPGGTTSVTLTLNWIPYGEHAAFYYGLEQGIFEEEGIDLTIRPGNGSSTTVQQVAQQQTDFGWADTPALMYGIDQGMPVKSAGVFLQKGPASMEFFASQGIEEPADLVGKTVAGTPGDAMYATFPAWLEANGVSPDDVTVVNVDPAGKISALIEGKVDVIMGFFHDQAPTIEDTSGDEVGTLLYADWGMNLLGTGIVVNNATLESDPDLVEAFVRATQRSWEAAADNPDAAVQAMAANAEEAPTEEVMREQFDQTVPLLQLDTAAAPGVNTEEQWQETINLLAEHADLGEAGEPSAYWDGSFAESE